MPYFTVRGPMPLSSFTPASLPNLLAWYKADADVYSDAGVTLATDGQQVAQWNDQSGNAYHLGKGGGTGLTYRTNQLNGLPILDNNGTMALFTTGNPVSWGGTVTSVFAVMKYTATGGVANRLVSMGANADDVSATNFTMYENNSLTIVRTYNNGDKDNVTISSSTWNQLGTIFDGSLNKMYLNNVAGAGVAASPTFDATANIGITTSPGGAANMLTGLVAEVVITKSEMASGDRASLSSYFTSKWGV